MTKNVGKKNQRKKSDLGWKKITNFEFAVVLLFRIVKWGYNLIMYKFTKNNKIMSFHIYILKTKLYLLIKEHNQWQFVLNITVYTNVNAQPVEKLTDWMVDFRGVPYNHVGSPPVCRSVASLRKLPLHLNRWEYFHNFRILIDTDKI